MNAGMNSERKTCFRFMVPVIGIRVWYVCSRTIYSSVRTFQGQLSPAHYFQEACLCSDFLHCWLCFKLHGCYLFCKEVTGCWKRPLQDHQLKWQALVNKFCLPEPEFRPLILWMFKMKHICLTNRLAMAVCGYVSAYIHPNQGGIYSMAPVRLFVDLHV